MKCCICRTHQRGLLAFNFDWSSCPPAFVVPIGVPPAAILTGLPRRDALRSPIISNVILWRPSPEAGAPRQSSKIQESRCFRDALATSSQINRQSVVEKHEMMSPICEKYHHNQRWHHPWILQIRRAPHSRLFLISQVRLPYVLKYFSDESPPTRGNCRGTLATSCCRI